jgi:hypothetical protein
MTSVAKARLSATSDSDLGQLAQSWRANVELINATSTPIHTVQLRSASWRSRKQVWRPSRSSTRGTAGELVTNISSEDPLRVFMLVAGHLAMVLNQIGRGVGRLRFALCKEESRNYFARGSL